MNLEKISNAAKPKPWHLQFERTAEDGVAVIADTGVSQTLSWLEVDPDLLLQRVRGEGIPERMIAKLSILFSNDVSSVRMGNGYYSTSFSEFDSNTMSIKIYTKPATVLRAVCQLYDKHMADSGDERHAQLAAADDLERNVDMLCSEYVSRTLWHELRHVKQVSEDPNLLSYERPLLDGKPVVDEGYWQDPAEIDAISAEQEVNTPYPVMVKLNQQDLDIILQNLRAED
ncbi:hypothetical protein EOL96_06630 [Candidatus Saccharibacteria bacterium]|nr:hypothetical protein [Candidatus Saccharibacteria bacterium]